MRYLTSFAVVLAVGGLASAQVPDLTGGAATAATTGAAAAAPARTGLFGRVLKTPEQRALCRIRFGQSPLGKLVNGLLKPLDALTGGIVKPVGGKDAVNPDNLKKPADSALGAAEKIKADEAQAKAKIGAIEELAKVDCKRYPEAEAALIAALRAEKNECVRLAAAKALLRGCCCSAKVVKALTVVVSGSDKDGNLAEDSERVRLTAFAALERCLRTCQPVKAEEPPEKPKPEAEGVQKASYAEMKEADIFAEARKVLAAGISVSPDAIRRSTEPANLKDLMFGPSATPVVVANAPPVRAERGLAELVTDVMKK